MERNISPYKQQAENLERVWYCLRSHPKHEYIAAAHLRLLERVYVFCPRIRFKRAARQGLAWVTEAMFAGYLFASIDLAKMHLQVRYARGVSAIVGFADHYPTIEGRALTQLRERASGAEIIELHCGLTKIFLNHPGPRSIFCLSPVGDIRRLCRL